MQEVQKLQLYYEALSTPAAKKGQRYNKEQLEGRVATLEVQLQEAEVGGRMRGAIIVATIQPCMHVAMQLATNSSPVVAMLQARAAQSEVEFMTAMEQNMAKLQDARSRIFELEAQQKQRRQPPAHSSRP